MELLFCLMLQVENSKTLDGILWNAFYLKEINVTN